MIRTALKHWVYECCIKVFFSGIEKHLFNLHLTGLYTGRKLNWLIIGRDVHKYRFEDVMIMNTYMCRDGGMNEEVVTLYGKITAHPKNYVINHNGKSRGNFFKKSIVDYG